MKINVRLIKMNNLKLQLEKYSNMIGVSGNEENIACEIEKDAMGFGNTNFGRSSMGDAIIYGGKRDSRNTCAIFAHMDEIGLMVSDIDEKGFISFVGIGGWYWNTAVSQDVIFENGVVGVIGSKPPHAMKPEEMKAGAKLENLFIDIGAKTAGEVSESGIKIGSTAVSNTKFQNLNNDMVTGKCLDNRAGVVVMLEVMRTVRPINRVIGVGTVQEEVGLKGAKVMSERLHPDLAIVIDTTLSGDHPGFTRKQAGAASGKVSITIADGAGRGILVPKHVIKYVKDIARKYLIPVEYSVSDGGTTDGMATHGNGIPTIVVSIPTRYIHSPVEVLDMNDVKDAIKLIVALCENYNRDYLVE